MKRSVRIFALFLMVLFVCSSGMVVNASNALSLYARWHTQITFDANSGTIAGGVTEAEKALAGRSSGSLSYSYNQVFATSLTAQRTGYVFAGWNTARDGTGTDIDEMGTVTGPVTFYAVWIQAKASYACTRSQQIYTVPHDGIYRITCVGATGAHGYYSGSDGTVYAVHHGGGATVSGEIALDAGTVLYIYVGGCGRQANGYAAGGYNGGGPAGGTSGWQGYPVTSGGGATDVRVGGTAMSNRIMVAGGSGGAANRSGGTGGYGGAPNGQAGRGSGAGAGATLSSGQASGTGGGGYSGGGGGYYGGNGATAVSGGGGGGSSYVSGYAGASAVPGYTFGSIRMTPGADAVTQPPNADGRCTIELVSLS